MAFVDTTLVVNSRVVNVGPLALLRALLDKLDLAAIIDRHLPTHADISHGTALAILLAARLHSSTALVNVADWAKEHGVEYLWNLPADKLNDDRLGRALDAFFHQRHNILAAVTHAVLGLTNLTLDCCHFDTTHLILYGAYASSVPRPHSADYFGSDGTPDHNLPHSRHRSLDDIICDIRMSPAHITHGYLTRYKMLQLGVTSVVDDLGPLPVACHLFDGNRNGHTGIKQQYDLLRSQLQLPDNFLLVSDRGTCSAEHLARLRRHGHYAICAGQWQDYGPLFNQHAQHLLWSTASYLSREQQRRRECNSSLPLDDYRLAVLPHQLVDPTTQEPFPCRVIFVHASAAATKSHQRRQRNITLIKNRLDAIARKLERAHPATTPATVTRQIVRLLANKSAATFFSWRLVPLSAAERAALPPPKKGFRQQAHRLEYAFDEAAAQADSRHDGIYALVTTAPLTASADELFTEYKRQTYVERGHHELKTPLAVTPIFLKSPQRVEALVSLLFLALQVAMTLERLYRQQVSPTAPPAEQRMTAEKILRTFRVCGLTVTHCSYGELVRADGLSPEQRRILNQLSLPTPRKLLREILAPPPT